jgi:hypothetical protein
MRRGGTAVTTTTKLASWDRGRRKRRKREKREQRQQAGHCASRWLWCRRLLEGSRGAVGCASVGVGGMMSEWRLDGGGAGALTGGAAAGTPAQVCVCCVVVACVSCNGSSGKSADT